MYDPVRKEGGREGGREGGKDYCQRLYPPSFPPSPPQVSGLMKFLQSCLSYYERAPFAWLRKKGTDFAISYIHAEDEQTNYVDIGTSPSLARSLPPSSHISSPDLPYFPPSLPSSLSLLLMFCQQDSEHAVCFCRGRDGEQDLNHSFTHPPSLPPSLLLPRARQQNVEHAVCLCRGREGE